MSLLHDVNVEDIKEPSFDRPERTDTTDPAVSGGSRVILSYHGQELSARVTSIERLGASFVGHVLRLARPEAGDDDLAVGDVVRFRLKDVHRTD